MWFNHCEWKYNKENILNNTPVEFFQVNNTKHAPNIVLT